MVLLYEDDAMILAEDEKLMRRRLEVVMEWCDQRAVDTHMYIRGYIRSVHVLLGLCVYLQ